MIYVNGSEHAGAPSIAALLETLGHGAQPRGLAVALDGEVVPRSQWPSRPLTEGARVEVVGATQGG